MSITSPTEKELTEWTFAAGAASTGEDRAEAAMRLRAVCDQRGVSIEVLRQRVQELEEKLARRGGLAVVR